MADPELTRRLRDYFTRQIQWLQIRMEEMENLRSRLDEHGLEPVLETEARRQRELAVFEEENRLLLREWAQSTALSSSERAEIQDLAAQSQALGEKLSNAYDTAEAEMQTQAAETREALGKVIRGRRTLEKYGNSETSSYPGSDFLDRQV
ncbi:MAG: hypothetical protein ACLFV4_04145 [Candidatus Hydrogenedentota bacterium]